MTALRHHSRFLCHATPVFSELGNCPKKGASRAFSRTQRTCYVSAAAAQYRSPSTPRHEFVEAADLPVLRLVLIQECQPGLVEFFEKLIPADSLQPSFPGAEIDSENAGISVFLGVFHRRRHAIALLDPCLDLVMVRGRVASTHHHSRVIVSYDYHSRVRCNGRV